MSALRSAVLPALLAGVGAAFLVGLPRPAAARLTAAVGRQPAAAAPALPAGAVLVAAVVGPLALLGPRGLPVAAVALLVALAGLRAWRSRQAAVARRSERARAAEACGVLAAELRAGRAVADALDAASEVGGPRTGAALRSAATAARLGADVDEVLVAAAADAHDAAARALVALAACWSVCATAGGGLAAAVERLADGLRAAEQQQRVVDAELAGPRATALLLAALPLGGLLLAVGLGGEPWAFLLGTPVGALCLAGGVALDAAGLAWTRRLVAGATP